MHSPPPHPDPGSPSDRATDPERARRALERLDTRLEAFVADLDSRIDGLEGTLDDHLDAQTDKA